MIYEFTIYEFTICDFAIYGLQGQSYDFFLKQQSGFRKKLLFPESSSMR